MAVSKQFLEYVLEQLTGMPALRPNRMFDGAGLYSNDVFFAVVHEDTLYFKTDETNIAGYRERRMPQFMPFKDRPATALGYHQVPADILEDPESLLQWARAAVSVALAKSAARKKKPAPKKAPGKAPKRARKAKRGASRQATQKPVKRNARRKNSGRR